MHLDLKKRLNTLVRHEWSLMDDIDWNQGIDLSKPLLGLSSDFVKECNLNQAEALAVSQTLGIMAISAIAEHENVLDSFKDSYWLPLMKKSNASTDLVDLGDQFFKEEKKHAEAFNQYIKMFAAKTNLSSTQLGEFLPKFSKDSIYTKLFRLNLMMGGQALWWAVATTEAESIDIYSSIKKSTKEVDPLYTQIHKLHFEEELRHKCYAFLMLELDSSSNEINFFRKILRRFDYMYSHLLEVTWAFNQLRRLKNVEAIATKHPIYSNLVSAIKKFEQLPLLTKIKVLLFKTPFLSPLLRLNRHREVREYAHTKKSIFANVATEHNKQKVLI